MKAVLISLKPRWVGEITSGKKKIEVRKVKPKIDLPFECYIYETQGRTETPFVDEEGHEIFKGRGQVIGEFICDRIETFTFGYHVGYRITPDELQKTCLTQDELMDYGRGETLYGWHISNLVIYEQPKELSDFRLPCNHKNDCWTCDRYDYMGHRCYNEITRPPQSYMFVEELKGETE
jgi:predicted transcriptional regulator